jgi:hypothetical protein
MLAGGELRRLDDGASKGRERPIQNPLLVRPALRSRTVPVRPLIVVHGRIVEPAARAASPAF